MRGKVAGFFIIEDIYFATATLGTEFGYGPHSLGIDGTFFRWRYETDDNSDVAMYENYERRLYLLADYKFHFPEIKAWKIYLNAYGKHGKYDMWYKGWDYPYKTIDTSFLRSTTTGSFIEFGGGIGCKYFFNWPANSAGLDFSFNVAQRLNKNNIADCVTSAQTNYSYGVLTQKTVFYIRVNLFIYLKY